MTDKPSIDLIASGMPQLSKRELFAILLMQSQLNADMIAYHNNLSGDPLDFMESNAAQAVRGADTLIAALEKQ